MKPLYTCGLLISALCLAACSTLELSTAYALAKVSPVEIDPQTGRVAIFWPDAFKHYRPPHVTFDAVKDGAVQIDGLFKLTTDPDSARFVPHGGQDGEIIVYAVDAQDFKQAYKAQDVLRDQKATDKLFGGAKWEVNTYTDFSFTVEESAYRHYCKTGDGLEISVWVRINGKSPFKRLVDEKGIDNFIAGQLKKDCNKPDTNLITRG